MPSAPAPIPPAPRPGPLAAWAALDHRQRRVAVAAALVLVTMLLPWFSRQTVTQRAPGSVLQSGSTVSALGALSFVEASLIVVLIGLLALLWGRATGRRFALPFPDGTLVCAAAGWMGLLITFRLFALPYGNDTAVERTFVDLSWGVFASLIAVGALFLTGLDLRRHGPREAVPGEPPPAPSPSPHDRVPDVDPETLVVTPSPSRRSRSPEPPRPAPRPDRPVHEWPSRMPRPHRADGPSADRDEQAPDGRRRAAPPDRDGSR